MVYNVDYSELKNKKCVINTQNIVNLVLCVPCIISGVTWQRCTKIAPLASQSEL